MSGPGWYPDPQDSASLRWFDGETWTDFRQPAESSTSEPVTADMADYAAQPVSATAGVGAYSSQSYDPYGDNRDQSGIGSVGGSNDAGGPAPSPVSVVAETPPAPIVPAAAAKPSGPSHSAGGRAKLDKRVALIVAIVVVVVAALVTGGILLFGGSDTSFTYQGKPLAQPSKTLVTAEDNLSLIVGQRHGVKSSATRCYFAQPTHPVAGKKSDIDSLIRCGPVLFVDGDSAKTFLSFPFTSAPSGDSVTLTPSSTPQSNSPDAVSSDLALKRPDGKAPPSGGLDVPNPPAADPNVLTTAVVAQPAGTKATTAIIGSLTGGITITDIGKVSRYGTGDDARSAPPNQLLYAFKLAGAAGNSGDVKDLSSSTVIAVDGAGGRALPVAANGQAIVIAVPNTTKSLDLVLTDSSLKQTFSLLDAKPGAANVAVLGRSHRNVTVNQTVTATYNYSTKVVFADKSTGQTQTASITLAGVTLAYRDDVNSVSASAPDKAFLIPDIVYTGSHDGGPYGIDTALLTFTPTGGAAIPAKNISTDGTKVRNVFEVPADVTEGTITIGGTANESFAGSTGTYVLTVAAPIGIPVAIPAG